MSRTGTGCTTAAGGARITRCPRPRGSLVTRETTPGVRHCHRRFETALPPGTKVICFFALMKIEYRRVLTLVSSVRCNSSVSVAGHIRDESEIHLRLYHVLSPTVLRFLIRTCTSLVAFEMHFREKKLTLIRDLIWKFEKLRCFVTAGLIISFYQ